MKINNEKYDIAVVIPTLNEEKGIAKTITSIQDALSGKYSFVFVIVDGHSTDKTVEIAKSLSALVIKQRRSGYGDALQAGFYFVHNKLKTSVTTMIDADGTYEPQDLVKMCDLIINGKADFVIGNRFAKMDKSAMTLTNKVGNKILSYVARKLLKVNVSDSQCGMRSFRSDLADIFYNSSLGMPFATEMLTAIATYRIRMLEIPTSYHKRVGETKLNPFQDGMKILSTILRLMRDTRPLSFFGLIGLLTMSIGFYFGTEVVVEYLKYGEIRKIPTTILTVLLLITGFQSITLGLISDMIKNKTYEKRIFFNE